MSSAYTTISSIETFYNSILDGDISENVYPSTLPPNRPDNWKDMAVISCDNGIKNKGAVNEGYVEIWLYAKPMANGKKNVAVMSRMENRLDEIIQEQQETNLHYRLFREETRTDYDSTKNMHVNIVRIHTTII